MSDDSPTVDATEMGAASDRRLERAYLIVSFGRERTQVIDLPDGAEVSFGRSRTATVVVDHDRISRLHARVTREGANIVVVDLDSKNGTRVNGTKIDGPTRLASGDEVDVGPVTAVLAVTSQLRKRTRIGSSSSFEERLEAEVDRAARHHRPLGLLMLRLPTDGEDDALERIAAGLRPMDCLAEYAPGELAIIVPEADRAATEEVARRAVEAAGVPIHVGLAVHPQDGAQPGELVSRARAALRRARVGGGATAVASAPVEVAPAPGDVIIADPQMRRVYEMVAKIASTPITVLILGETGVGKEIIAERLHRSGARAKKPFVKLNCAALPETLLESELFGYERGAFTGADKRKTGYFEAASGGTVFLDEIGETPLALQAKLLRVLESKKITRVGGTKEIDVDVRLVCATNRDLEAEVRAGRFRQDLYFRVSAFTVMVPPLRDRRVEIAPLAEHFARLFARELGQPAPPLSAEARRALSAYDWPGNIRELKNAIERAVVLDAGGAIAEHHLPDAVRAGSVPVVAAGAGEGAMRDHIADVERATIVAGLEAANWNQTHAAKRLGLSRRALIYKMEKYGLKAPPGAGR